MTTPATFSAAAFHDIPSAFAAVVAVSGDREAVSAAGQSLTYAEIDGRSNQVATAITDRVGPGTNPVMLLMSHDANLPVGILGVLKAGRPYASALPGADGARLGALVDFLRAPLVLCDESHLSTAHNALADIACAIVCVGRDTDREPDAAWQPIGSPDRVAAVTLTSGTTGRPKGIMRSQLSQLRRVMLDQERQQIAAGDRIAMLYHASFGASQADLFTALLTGATVCLYDLGRESVSGLASWIQSQRLTRLHLPVDLFRQWLDLLPADAYFDSLRQVAPAGRILRSDVERIRRHLPPECKIITRLASGETGLVAQMEIDAHSHIQDEVLPVGYVMPDVTIRIINEKGEPVAAGEIGEILVAAHHLALGYWRDPELTARAFWPDPDIPSLRWYSMGDLVRQRPDGSLEFHGRRDERVKVSGYTVELTAVEAALLTLKQVAEAAVVAPALPSGERRLVAFVAPAVAPWPSVGELRRALAGTLAPYMVPGAIVIVDRLPLTANGKIDRRTLTDLASTQRARPHLDTAFVPPRTPVEAMIAAIWADVLDLDEVGVEDHFLEVGGNSILAVRIAARVVHQSGTDSASTSLLSSPTVAAMAAALAKAALPGDGDLLALLAAIELMPDGDVVDLLAGGSNDTGGQAATGI